jgi:hypothetical protein
MPNTRVTPCATRVSTRTSATVRLAGPVRESDVDAVGALLDVIGRDGVGEVARGRPVIGS